MKLEDSPPRRSNQEFSEPVVESKEVGLRERLTDSRTRQEAEFWLGFFDTPSDSEGYQQLANGLDLEAGSATHVG